MLDRLTKFFSSLRLTVACLVCAMVLVFAGTLAQVKLGLYQAQSDFFRSVFIYWHPTGGAWKIPIFPGGWLLGGILLINLLAAHARRFEISRKKSGIFLIHGGLILLLLGQFFTEILQVESAMRLEEGETRNYSEDFRKNELAVIDASSPDSDRVVSIPESFLEKQKEISSPELPFTLRVRNYWVNSDLTRETNGVPTGATAGIGTDVRVIPEPLVTSMDQRNLPSAVIEVVSPKGSLGVWLVSTLSLARQSFSFDGKTYDLAFRFQRYYRPFYLTLLEFRHDLYKGTDKPKNFSSRVHIHNPQSGDDRDALIYMNNPLRYAGETFYQASFDKVNPKVTVLQVVKNPAAITPYLSCTIMAAGLLTQFLMHLYNFVRKRSSAVTNPAARPGKSRGRADEMEPALAGNGSAKSSKRRSS